MLKNRKLKMTSSDVVRVHQEQALGTTMLLLRTYGPTGFLLQEEGQDNNHKVFLGQRHSCTCAAFMREQEPCKHICWLFLKKFRLPRDHEYSFQCGLSERQISEVLNHSLHEVKQARPSAATTAPAAEGLDMQAPGQVPQRDIQPQDVCPICQDVLLESRKPVAFCRYSCGNNVHLSCMKVLLEHQRRSDRDSVMVKCPLCREDFCSIQSLSKQVTNAAKLFTAGERARPDKHLGLSRSNCRVSPISGECARKPSSLVPPDPPPPSGFALMPGVQVRMGSQLLLDGMQCRLCLQRFVLGQSVRALPCNHKFHCKCVDPILQTINACPIDGYVFYKHEARTGRDIKTTSKPTRSDSRPSVRSTKSSIQDLFVPGVALQHKQREVPSISSQTPQSADLSLGSAITLSGLGDAPSLGSAITLSGLGDAPSLGSAITLSGRAVGQTGCVRGDEHPSPLVGVTSPPWAKASVRGTVRAQPKRRGRAHTEACSQLIVTGTVQAPQDMI